MILCTSFNSFFELATTATRSLLSVSPKRFTALSSCVSKTIGSISHRAWSAQKIHFSFFQHSQATHLYWTTDSSECHPSLAPSPRAGHPAHRTSQPRSTHHPSHQPTSQLCEHDLETSPRIQPTHPKDPAISGESPPSPLPPTPLTGNQDFSPQKTSSRELLSCSIWEKYTPASPIPSQLQKIRMLLQTTICPSIANSALVLTPTRRGTKRDSSMITVGLRRDLMLSLRRFGM